MLGPDTLLPLKFCRQKGRMQRCNGYVTHTSSPETARCHLQEFRAASQGGEDCTGISPHFLHLTVPPALQRQHLCFHQARLPHKDLQLWDLRTEPEGSLPPSAYSSQSQRQGPDVHTMFQECGDTSPEQTGLSPPSFTDKWGLPNRVVLHPLDFHSV